MFPGSRSIAPQSSSITAAPNLKWTKINGHVQETLLSEMQKMYWDGVKRELTQILLTLRKWQQAKFDETILPDEKDDFIHGFDTFVDQVSDSSRDFAVRYGGRVKNWRKGEEISWKRGFLDQGMDYYDEWKSSTIKLDIRERLAGKWFYIKVVGTS